LIFTFGQLLSNATDGGQPPSTANMALPSTAVNGVSDSAHARTSANAGNGLKNLALLDVQTSPTS